MRKYPTSMATQHPDNSEKYIAIQNEPEEALHILDSQEKGGLGIEEIMIDFEGKLTPYHQTSQIALGLIGKGIIPGKDVMITPRIPNAIKEPVFRQLMSIMSLVETNILAYKETQTQAIIETIVPMIEKGSELIALQKRISSVIELGNKNYDIQFPLDSIKIIPLVETVPALIRIDRILDDFHQNQKGQGQAQSSYRVMLARSDSAMSYGMIPSVLAIRIALSKLSDWSKRYDVEVAPILGCGSLPFRGHLSLENLGNILNTYAGIRTFTIQSGMRYDHGEEETKEVVEKLKEKALLTFAHSFRQREIDEMQEYIGIFTKHYIGLFTKMISTVDFIARYIPKNRDRLAGAKTALQYSRESIDIKEIADLVHDQELKKELLSINTNIESSIPRAISFTGALYTIGTPPEFIGTGRGLSEILNKYGKVGIEKLLKFYPQLKEDLQFASKYVNIKAAKGVLDESARVDYENDYQLACEILDINQKKEENNGDELYHTILEAARPIILHLTGNQNELFENSDEEQRILRDWIIKMGKLRGSLG